MAKLIIFPFFFLSYCVISLQMNLLEHFLIDHFTSSYENVYAVKAKGYSDAHSAFILSSYYCVLIQWFRQFQLCDLEHQHVKQENPFTPRPKCWWL